MKKDLDVEEIELELLLSAVYQRFQYDFSSYTRSSLRRRLTQALSDFGLSNITQLQERLLHDDEFFPKLLNYLTVNTTELFRDPEYFKTLKEKVFPYLRTFPSVKIWIAGCSTGEEIISFAILLKEAGIKRYIIYATDINPMNLEKASKGIYSQETVLKGTKNYRDAGGVASLSEYYEAAYESVKFDPELLKSVVFSDHSLATDAVFSETHLISCRNVLIYFERDLQNRAFKLFKDSLLHGTFLGIGSKETITFSVIKDDFMVIDSVNKVYQKK